MNALDAAPGAVDNDAVCGPSGDAPVWIAKPVYESLPYFYLLVGAVTLLASLYVTHWHWPAICFTVGLGSLVAGIVVLLKRRDARSGGRQTRPPT